MYYSIYKFILYIFKFTQVHSVPNQHHRVFSSFLLFYNCNSLSDYPSWTSFPQWGCPSHQALAFHIWFPLHGNAFLILCGLLHPALGHHDFLHSPLHTHKHTPQLALLHLMALELNFSGREKKEREGGRGTWVAFIVEEKSTGCVELFFLQLKIFHCLLDFIVAIDKSAITHLLLWM